MSSNGNGSALVPTTAWTREQVDLIKRTCVPAGEPPPDDAFAVFLHVCKQSGLDPLLREAWLISRRSKDARGNWTTSWQTMAGRDGYLAAAHRTGELRGITTRVYPEDASQAPTHATCTVHRAGWTAPVEVTVAFREYVARDREGKPTALWRDKPRTMIAKVAESHALRRAFSLHGTYCPEELPPEGEEARYTEPMPPNPRLKPLDAEARSTPAPEPDAPAQPEPAALPAPSHSATLKAAFARWGSIGGSDSEFKQLVQRITGKASRKQCTAEDWAKVHVELDKWERANQPPDDEPPPTQDDAPPEEVRP